MYARFALQFAIVRPIVAHGAAFLHFALEYKESVFNSWGEMVFLLFGFARESDGVYCMTLSYPHKVYCQGCLQSIRQHSARRCV